MPHDSPTAVPMDAGHFWTDALGVAGVSLLLIAFLLTLLGRLHPRRTPYLVLNFVGGSLAAAAAVLIPFWPFVVLEVTWAAVAAWWLWRRWVSRE